MSGRPDVSLSRRAFLRFASPPKSDAIRPPWSDEKSVLAHCTGCNDCVKACPEKIISLDEARRPVLQFDNGYCTFCGACAEACPTDAIDSSRELDWPWIAEIQPTCLSLQAVMCRTCEDVCEPRAIRFKLALGGKSEPIVDNNQCTGCGACANSCPAQAIDIKRTPAESGEVKA